jgi:cytosine/adenosine deaminase-related metal-dependent hydrolase
VQTTDEILKDSQRAIETYHDANPFSMRQVVRAPCSPFSITGELMKQSAKLARSYGVKLHTHLCETKDEERFTVETFGMRPLAYMESVDFVGSDVFYAHGIYFNDEELRFLRKRRPALRTAPART